MKTEAQQAEARRLGGLRRFAIAITLLNILGHTLLGFEQAWLHPFVGLAAAYSTELLLETVDAWSKRRRARFVEGGVVGFVDFMLSAHITGLAVSMLLYANENFWVVAFGVTLAMASKAIFRVPVGGGGYRHFLNPSNFGITCTLLLFHWVGFVPPYHFTENVSGLADWLLPGLIIVTGSFLNARFTRRMPLVAGWLGGFALQATVRAALLGTSLATVFAPMTGLAFVLFTYYMVTDPATTPESGRWQVLFGAAVALLYGVLTVQHVVFGLFFALTAVCVLRGVVLLVAAQMPVRAVAALRARAPRPTGA